MYSRNPYSSYANSSIYTAPKEELTLMLYDGALKFANRSIMAMQNQDFSKANELSKRVQDIYRELQITLDQKYDVSKSLYPLYEYAINRCIDANLKKDEAIMEEVRDMTREFRDTWKEAMKLAKK